MTLQDAEGVGGLARVWLCGEPPEMGRQHGAALAGLIPDVLENHRPPGGMTPDLAAALRALEATLATDQPDVLAEIAGIAAGAGVPYDDVLLLNVGYDACADTLPSARFCTAIGLPNTPDGPLVAKTDDVAIEQRCFEVCFRARPSRGYAHIRYAFAGTVWNQGGMNAAGLAVAMTGLPPAGRRNRAGIPGLILLQQMLLRCATADEAIAYAYSHPLRGYGFSVTLADATSGDVMVAEVSGAGGPETAAAGAGGDGSTVGYRRSAREATLRTNHPRLAESIILDPDRDWRLEYGYQTLALNSEVRYDNARRLVQDMPWTFDGLRSLLGNHAAPGAICQHGQGGLHTSFAMIMIPHRRAMIVSEGYGCGNYVEFTV